MHQAPAHDFEVSLQYDIDCFRISDVFLLKNALRQAVFVVIIEDRDRLLNDNGAVIEFRIHKMHCAARDSDTVGKCLLLRLQAWECGKERGVDVEDAVRKPLNEPG